ncbi:MATE family efflux transporter [Treponema sp.]|uniref:MATE family efflux transporter n=1 Tax=Treponema sp. TaxID=166 RepID=UPI0025FCA804|nr:MATE family efflux transporter [Treponema sp.]MCR5218637.1 MATE family efflux transporter [Treponema sp.]
MQHKSNQIDMTNGNVFLKLTAFSIPLIFSSVLQLLFNAADVVVVGRYAGEEALAAVGSTGSLINLLVNLFLGLSIGANVVAARYFGAGKKDRVSDTVHTSIIMSVFSGLFLTFTGVFLSRQILIWMQSPEDVLELSALYLRIYFAGIIPTVVYNFGSALLRAKGDTKRPLYYLFAAGILNVLLNLFFVIVCSMSVAGVALATVISQTLAAFLVIICLIREKDEFHLDIKKLKPDYGIMRQIIKIGLPAGFQGIVFSLSNVIIQSSVNSFGKITVAGNSAASNIEGFVYISMNGFSQGTLTFVSQNMGKQDFDRIKKVTLVSLATVFATGLIFGNTVAFLGKYLVGFYNSKPDVIREGVIRLNVICTTYALCGIMDVMGSVVRGMGHSMKPMAVSMLGACGSRILWIATVFQIPEYHSCFVVFLSYPVSWFITFVVHLLVFFHVYKTERQKSLS